MLGKLAYEMQVENLIHISSKGFQKLFDIDSVNEAMKLLDNIQQITGVIINKNEKWHFSHKSLFEYFCAFYLVERSKGFDKTYKDFETNINWKNIWKKSFGLSLDPEFYISNKNEALSVDYLQILIKCQDILRESIILEKYLVKRIIDKTVSFYEKFGNKFKSEKIEEFESSCINNKLIRVSPTSNLSGKKDELIFKLVIRLNFLLIETRWTIYSKNIYRNLSTSKSTLLNEFKEIYLKEGKSICHEHGSHADYFLTDEISK